MLAQEYLPRNLPLSAQCGPHASPLCAHPPSIPRPGTLSQPQPSRRAAAAQARTAAGPKAQGVGGGRGGAAAAEAAAAPEALAKRLRRPRAKSALPVCRRSARKGQQHDLVLPHPQLWKTASPERGHEQSRAPGGWQIRGSWVGSRPAWASPRA